MQFDINGDGDLPAMHIVLDMDGTLIDNLGKFQARPYLFVFLLYCFTNFDSVSIWTAANDQWYDMVFKYILNPMLERISDILKYQCNFMEVFTRERCSILQKRLRKLWRKYDMLTRDNTIVIDDIRETFTYNYGNGIEIYPYGGTDTHPDDLELLKLCYYLTDVRNYYDRHKTIRTMEKRNWMHIPEHIHNAQKSDIIIKHNLIK